MVNAPKTSSLRFIDLFCGIGGIRLGFEKACRKSGVAAVCVFSQDHEKDCADVYQENFGEDPTGEITTTVADAVPDFDVLLAGFPCQSFSVSGKMQGFSDTRGTLFYDILRIVKAKKPKAIFLENVKNLVAHDNRRTFQVIKKSLEDEGYDVSWRVLCSSDFGVPQARERVYIVATKGAARPMEFPKPQKKTLVVADILEPKVGAEYFVERKDVFFTKKRNSLPAVPRRPLQLGYVNQGGQGERIYSTKAAGVTLSAYGGGVGAKTGLYAVGRRLRKLTARECARLQGYPESFKIHPNYRVACRHFGNSVSVPVIFRVAECLIAALFGSE